MGLSTPSVNRGFFERVPKTLAAQFASTLAFLIASVVTARFLGPEGRGLYVLVFTTAGLCAQLLYLGMTQANVYYLNQEGVEDSTIIGNTVSFLTCQTILLVLLLFFFGPSLQVALNFPSEIFLVILAIATISLLAVQIFQGYVLGKHHFRLYLFSLWANALLVLAATLPVIRWFDYYEVVVWLRGTASAAVAVLFIAFIYKACWPVKAPEFSAPLLVLQLRFGFKNYFQNIVGSLNHRMYLFFLALNHGNGSVGLFSVVLIFAEFVRFVPDALGPLLLSHFVGSADRDKNIANTARVMRILLALTGLGLLLVAPIVIHISSFLFGEAYQSDGVATSIYIILAGAFAGIPYQILTRFYTSSHSQIYSIYSGLMALAISLVLAAALVPSLNVLGASISFCAGMFFSSFASMYFFCSVTKCPLGSALFVKRVDLNLLGEMVRALLVGRSKRGES